MDRIHVDISLPLVALRNYADARGVAVPLVLEIELITGIEVAAPRD
jgi:hypothetical protein